MEPVTVWGLLTYFLRYKSINYVIGMFLHNFFEFNLNSEILTTFAKSVDQIDVSIHKLNKFCRYKIQYTLYIIQYTYLEHNY